ncbi:MAG: hypothetical protein JST55_03970 [Bacteroidetes bacterium]|nr:hypothetical protein [Bacteroidota bacterium]
MKKVLLFMAFFCGINISYSQNFNWITPNKTYLKLYLVQDGVYRINKSDFTNAGISTSSIDPRTIKVLYKGNQVPIYFEGESDGVFNDNDFFDFYGTRNFGGNTKYVNGYNNRLSYTKNEYYNNYSDTSVYWVDWGGTNGLRMTDVSSSNSFPAYPNPYYFESVHKENDIMYSLGEHPVDSDYRYFNPELVEGEGWYWNDLFNLYSIKDSAKLKNPFISVQPICKIKFFAYPNANDNNILRIVFDNYPLGFFKTTGYQKYDTTISFPSTYIDSTIERSKVVFTYYDSTNISPPAPPYGNVYFDYFELIYPSKFKFFENNLYADLAINNPSADTTTKRFKITGFTSPNGLTLYDVRNGIRITNSTVSGDTLLFSAKGNANLRITNSNVYLKPFRIKQKQVANLVTGAADYLIVYHPLFVNAAEQLRQHRQSYDTLRSVKASIEDIYDVFNYGMEDPKAVRTFVKNAYISWTAPKPRYLCLFGRGSIDPKKNSSASQIYINYVPSYGNPTCDGYFGNVNESALVYVPNLSIGRLPAYSEQEANDIVSKIIAYDNQRHNYEAWWKKDVMVTGGLNSGEQTGFQLEANSIISLYFNPNPLRLSSDKIYRNDAGGGISFQFSDSIINTFNRGAMYFNYIGHAGNGTWDNGLENPDLLSNGNKLPLVFSMTCFTGKNAINEFRGFGEKFIYLPNKGAIGYVGNTGWTFSSNGEALNRRFLDGMKGGLRRQGEIMKYGIASDTISASDSGGYSSRFTLNTYCLLGDPAAKILLPSYPEFEILPGNFSMSNSFPAVNDPVNIKFYTSNYGIGVDSVKMRFQFYRNGIAMPPKDTILRNFGRLVDTVGYNFTITSSGNYSLKFTIDPDNRYPLEDKTNNSINVNIPIRNVSYVPLKPVDNAFILTDSVEFVGINPNVDPQKNTVKVLLQVDTNLNFTNPRIFFKQVTEGVVTKFRTTLPVADTNLVYYWRMNSVVNNDSSGWSNTQRLIYNPSGTLARSHEAPDSVVKLSKKRLGQYDAGSYQGLSFVNGTGFTLPFVNADLRVLAHGNNGEEASEFTFNGGRYIIDNGSFPGICFFIVNKLTGRPIDIKGFRMSSPSSSDSIVTYLNGIDSNKFVMISTVQTFAGDSLRENARNKIKEFGSVMVDSMRNHYGFQTWAFIGSKGASPLNCSEDYHPNNVVSSCVDNWCTSNAAINRPFQTIKGTLTQNFGPAKSWNNFIAFQNVQPFSAIKYNVYGKNTADQTVLLYTNISSPFNFDTLNALTYPNITITSSFSLDSLQGNVPPSLKSFVLNYVPPVELAVDNYSFTKSDTVLQEGDSVTLGVKYTNVGYSQIYSMINTWYTFVNGQKKYLKVDTLRTPIQVDEVRNSQVRFSTYGFGHQSDSVTVYFDSYPAYAVNEFNSYNNTGVTQIIVKSDSLKPVADITFDGHKLNNGDYIQARPEIVISLYDDSPIAIDGADTNTVKIKLDSKYVPYANNPDLQFIVARGYKLAATVKYYPKLSEGTHSIEFDFVDKTGNIGDTVKNNFQVSYDLKLLDLYNFPNPLKDKTSFMFNLQGEKRPDTGKIKIYTAAGRLIKEINLDNLSIGYNQVEWDGRDNDGDAIANGIYFYKMILTGNSKIETKIEKIAILK